ncbi:hypothetical protein E2C01_080471 [Portunus trituberculatus]|uniref:Uncharacterized protein n=1 Tax=Portunus trituberculatus TaxID=210409 RepID=A0A5B7IW80_PORTR|nr:hypothetical protein [Portunus trituberculatus]
MEERGAWTLDLIFPRSCPLFQMGPKRTIGHYSPARCLPIVFQLHSDRHYGLLIAVVWKSRPLGGGTLSLTPRRPRGHNEKGEGLRNGADEQMDMILVSFCIGSVQAFYVSPSSSSSSSFSDASSICSPLSPFFFVSLSRLPISLSLSQSRN